MKTYTQSELNKKISAERERIAEAIGKVHGINSNLLQKIYKAIMWGME